MDVSLLCVCVCVRVETAEKAAQNKKAKVVKDDIWFDGVDPFDIEKTVPDFELTDDVKVVKSVVDPTKQIELKDDDK